MNTLNLQELERETILKALFIYKGEKQEASKALGISRASLYRKIKQYGIVEYFLKEYRVL